MRLLRKSSRMALIAAGVLFVSLVAVPSVHAQITNDPAGNPHPVTRAEAAKQAKDEARQRAAQAKQRLEKAKAEAARRRAEATDKLVGAKLRVCQNREQAINRLLGRIGDRGQKQLELIDKIAAGTQQYYTDKKLEVANYDELAATMASAKATARSAVEAVKNARTEFKCDGTDPKGAASSFKDLMQARDAALRAYRDAVRNLVVAVRQAQGQSTGQTGGRP